ncbi:MAG: hypothetical protein ACYS99_19090 [Planctomycetota bacterium]|jgi:hypothetical protein
MNQLRNTTLACGAVLVAILLTGGPIHAGDAVPFKATVTTTNVTLISLDPFTLHIEASGVGTHLGTCDLSSITTWTPKAGGLWFEGNGTITAANGDELHFTSYGWSFPGSADGDYEILGGTGRFEGATGSGSFEVSENADLSQTAVFDGTIDFK